MKASYLNRCKSRREAINPDHHLLSTTILYILNLKYLKMSAKSAVDVARLLNLVELINNSAKTIINEWADAPDSDSSEVRSGLLDSRDCYNAQRTILGAAGMLTEVVGEPNNRLLEVSSQYFESRALHIAAEHRIPDILAGHDEEGVSVGDIGAKIGIESLKLCKFLNSLDLKIKSVI
jgi:hypothetical protein